MLHIMDYENTYNQILGWKLIFHSLDKSFDLTFEFIATWSIHLNFLLNTLILVLAIYHKQVSIMIQVHHTLYLMNHTRIT